MALVPACPTVKPVPVSDTFSNVECTLSVPLPSIVLLADSWTKIAGRMGDLFGPVLKLKQRLPHLAGLAAGEDEKEKEKDAVSIAAKAEPSARASKKKAGQKKAAPKRGKV